MYLILGSVCKKMKRNIFPSIYPSPPSLNKSTKSRTFRCLDVWSANSVPTILIWVFIIRIRHQSQIQTQTTLFGKYRIFFNLTEISTRFYHTKQDRCYKFIKAKAKPGTRTNLFKNNYSERVIILFLGTIKPSFCFVWYNVSVKIHHPHNVSNYQVYGLDVTINYSRKCHLNW